MFGMQLAESGIIAEFAVVCPIVFALVMILWLDRMRPKSRDRNKHNDKLGRERYKSVNDEPCALCKQLEADLAFGGPAKVLATWREMHSRADASSKALRIVVQAFVAADPESLVSEICEHMDQNPKLCTREVVTNLLDTMARVGQTSMMEEFLCYMRKNHRIQESEQINDIFLGAFAFTGEVDRVYDLMHKIRSQGRISLRGYCLIIKGFLKNRMIDAALTQMKTMREQGLSVPSFAVTKMCRIASEIDECGSIIDGFGKYSIPVSSPDVSILMKDCQKRNDLKCAFRVEELARIFKTPLMMNAYDAFLMLCVSHGDVHAFKLFEEMKMVGTPSPGLCLGLIARCPETKFCRFADMLVEHLRKTNDMSIQAYIALMKVYANCNMYNEACDLYAQIIEEGLKPDSVMYGCLMKFAVECGRTELAEELSRVAPQLEIQSYMSLLKAAGRDRDIERAFRVVGDMKANGVKIDIAAYSCVLDACALAGDMKRARSLLLEMQETCCLDVVAYNTVLKGYCKSGDSIAAMEFFSEMDAAGIQPNDVSFNCLINASAATGNFKEAWSLVEMMESRGLKIDNYTMSSLMKVLKNARFPHPKDIAKAFSLLDRSGVDIFSDEVLLNVVLETCTRHRQLTRLSAIFSYCMKAERRPSVHTTGLLIKASGMLRRIDMCHELWDDLIEKRKISPNDYLLGYMLDALVNNDCVEDAYNLLNTWENEVPPNDYLYSTILKGLAKSKQTGRLAEIYEEIRAKASNQGTSKQPRLHRPSTRNDI
eukprot:CAMPEP_0169086600 /NCGR_PEP_ID=MMETSP1015-20121227/13783_1 /TAXON_ID=342587 /ORGANISM="Karlodinium micrum, Strain CCMP2283" /LENGTH=767 /DNA_ID=CAMNT_0009146771 /DNA_START=81 /DNA_END=2384 /DNA_ORIENTATION=-